MNEPRAVRAVAGEPHPTPSAVPDEAAENASTRFAIFAFLFALAIFVDHVRVATLTSPVRLASVLAAVAVMSRPSSVRLFLVVVVVHTVEMLVRLPETDNLQTLLLLLGVTMLAALPAAGGRLRALPTGPRWLAAFEPLVRLATIVVYAVTFWHKLNVDFLAIDTSCAVGLYDNMLRQAWMPGELLPPGHALAPLLIGGTLVFEGGLPLLLAFPRTARIGIVAGLGFHYLLGLARFYEFSLLAAALFFLFAPPAVAGALPAWWRAHDRRRLAAMALAAGAALTALAGVQIADLWYAALPLRDRVGFAGHLLLAYGWWLSAAPQALFACLLWRLPATSPPPRPRFAPHHSALLVFPLLVLVNGVAPYLGLKTESAFAMYSNLRTEGGRTNHLLLRAPVALADYQTRLVRIVESTDEALAAAAREGRPVPLFDLRRLVHERRSDVVATPTVVYERDGAVYRVPPVDADPALASPPSYWERKLLGFREIHLDPKPCTH